MQICSRCNLEKQENEFVFRKGQITKQCKECQKKYENNRRNTPERKKYVKENCKKYREKNIDSLRTYNREYKKNREKDDIFFCFKNKIRSLINSSFKYGKFNKKSKTSQLLQCTLEEFYSHLGQKPEGNIDLDHICPCAQAKNEEEFIKLQHYSNFRWMNKKDNISKFNHKTPEGAEMCIKLLRREWI